MNHIGTEQCTYSGKPVTRDPSTHIEINIRFKRNKVHGNLYDMTIMNVILSGKADTCYSFIDPVEENANLLYVKVNLITDKPQLYLNC